MSASAFSTPASEDYLQRFGKGTRGTGYYSFWQGNRLRQVSDGFMSDLNESHNGYLETYLNSGYIGVVLLVVLLLPRVKEGNMAR